MIQNVLNTKNDTPLRIFQLEKQNKTKPNHKILIKSKKAFGAKNQDYPPS